MKLLGRNVLQSSTTFTRPFFTTVYTCHIIRLFIHTKNNRSWIKSFSVIHRPIWKGPNKPDILNYHRVKNKPANFQMLPLSKLQSKPVSKINLPVSKIFNMWCYREINSDKVVAKVCASLVWLWATIKAIYMIRNRLRIHQFMQFQSPSELPASYSKELT